MHGHEDVSKVEDQSVIMNRDDGKIVANAKLVHYTEITDDNIGSFHFHGQADEYPLSAVIVLPFDTKSGTILRGRYLEEGLPYQLVQPKVVIDGLLENIFRIKNVMDAVIVVVGFATVLTIILVFALSLRLRQREINTIFKLGCSRRTIAYLVMVEILIIVLLASVLCMALLLLVDAYSSDVVRALFIN